MTQCLFDRRKRCRMYPAGVKEIRIEYTPEAGHCVACALFNLAKVIKKS